MIDLRPGYRIGQAHHARVKTGVTVILPNAAAIASVDVRGGGPGTRELSALQDGGLIERVEAIVLAGGSVYGLAATDAVTAWLGAQRIGFAPGPAPVPGTDCPHAWIYERGGEFGDKSPPADYAWLHPVDTKLAFLKAAGQSTVIGAVMTDAKLSQKQLKRIAIMAQDGIAMAVQPSHTPLDGDTIFALSVGDKACPGAVDLAELGAAAARAVARALTRGVLKGAAVTP